MTTAKKRPIEVAIDLSESQAALARQLGVNPSAVSQWVTRRTCIGQRYFAALVRIGAAAPEPDQFDIADLVADNLVTTAQREAA